MAGSLLPAIFFILYYQVILQANLPRYPSLNAKEHNDIHVLTICG